MNPLRSIARKLKLGVLLVQLRRTHREGYAHSLAWRLGEIQMRRAARRLTAPKGAPLLDQQAEVVTLTGRSFIHQTAFCLYSLQQTCGALLSRVRVVDDGSLDQSAIDLLKQICPHVVIQLEAESLERLERALPRGEFPVLWAERARNIHLRKVLDSMAGFTDARLLLDGDMLFHHRPDELIAWLANPIGAWHLRDPRNSYALSIDEMSKLAGTPISECFNAGLLAVPASSVDFHFLERCLHEIRQRNGARCHFVEQSLWTLMFSRLKSKQLPADGYITHPNPEECIRQTAKLHHYTNVSRLTYLKHCWRDCLRRSQ